MHLAGRHHSSATEELQVIAPSKLAIEGVSKNFRSASGDVLALDRVSLKNFVAVARGAVERSGGMLTDVGYLCGIHMKPSMHRALLAELGIDGGRAAYLDDTGHMSGVDPLFALDRAARAGDLRDGELVLLLAAGTGYTWAASVVRWGDAEAR